MKFSVLAVFASLAVSSYASTTSDVLADIASISSQLTTLDQQITSFPATGGSLAAALAIHTGATNLVTSINKGTTDGVSPTPFSESDGNSVVNAVNGFVPTILDALKEIVIKKPAFDGLPIGGIGALVKQDLINLNSSTSSFEAGLIAASPTDLISVATSIKSTVDAALASAIAAYATP
ncbi:hydrophobic surface binding protein [Pholiota conissans]|uniref:Hydrophobic surface binding protein n=1 Tax=Pholiota conissans TaxID=109636 RepID=A0A9P6D215_9AGAR|nr:hydrophobic surface binding protein [Pholiota conissans]